jgi:methionyl-tRNA formyltransferase
MRLLMMGTGPFAVPTFRALLDAGHEMAALVTSPIRMHRGKPVAPISRIRDIATEHGVPILDPEDVNEPAFHAELAARRAELLVVCDYGQILAPATLAAARRGGINLHASLLPKYRGAAPINWALFHGETETGVTVIHMTPGVDAGPCLAQSRMVIGPEETTGELEPRLAELGAGLTCETVARMATDDPTLRPLAQDPALASKAPRLKKTDGLIDWTRPAFGVKNQIRAMEPWPRNYTFWHPAAGPAVRLIFGPVSVVESTQQTAPGTVLEAFGGRLVIAAGHGTVAPTGIQPAGKRMMAVDEFLRGHAVHPGDWFGTE